MQHQINAHDLDAPARAALVAATRDPILDGLVGWYAMDAGDLGDGRADAVDVDQLLAGADRDTDLYGGYTVGVLAAAGVLRAVAWCSTTTAAGHRRAA
ncbi:hypothetical protein K1W54_12470 [Micromonospora sp. CPCC 205371]|nr:hypothetical protein [Micromonospora sp. CPCC 205371]